MATKPKVIKGDFVQSLGKVASKMHEAYEGLDDQSKDHLPKRVVVEALDGVTNMRNFVGKHSFEIILGLGAGLALYALRSALEVDADDLLE